MEKFSSRSRFRESLNAKCGNAQWSWSWVNHDEKKVYFGASDVHEKGDAQLILGHQWQRNRTGRRNPGYAEAIENVNLVQSKNYSLYTFRQFEKVIDKETGRVRITGFEQDLERRYLVEKNDGWYALARGDFEAKQELQESKAVVVYLEGSRIPISGSRIERNSQARAACLRIHGTSCCICGFNFEKIYGALGADFIHVHHLKPISESTSEHIVCPKNDLRPVCPNCHAMIHRNGENRSIEEIKDLVAASIKLKTDLTGETR